MRLFTTCTVGLEESAKKELESTGFKDIQIQKGYCTAEFKNYEELIAYAYTSNLTIRTGLLLYEGKISQNLTDTNDNLTNFVTNTKWNDFFDTKTTFRVECEREGTHEFKSNEFERFLGGLIYDRLKVDEITPKVSLKNADLNIHAQIFDEQLMLGIDFIGFDSNKRDYKLFSNPHSIKGDLGYAMVQLGLESLKTKKNVVILDPFCSDGVIGIEAALYLNKRNHNNYRKKDFILKKLNILEGIEYKKIFDDLDKEEIKSDFKIYAYDYMLHNIKTMQKNAKIAGIDKAIIISKVDADSLDLKFEKATVDIIITVLPSRSRFTEPKKIKEMVDTLFYQAKHILKKNGNMILLTEMEDYIELTENYDLKVEKEIKIKENSRKIYKIIRI